MSHRDSRKAGGLRRFGGKCGACIAERMEDRRLLAAVSFGTPISTSLPASFTPVNLIPTRGNNDVFTNGFIATDSAGGGVLLKANTDGTFNTVQTLAPPPPSLARRKSFPTAILF